MTSPLRYVPLKQNDGDLPLLREIHRLPQITRFIHINEERYFDYVTGSDQVVYYKVLLADEIVAALHCELENGVLYLSLLVLPKYQRRGLGSQILRDLRSGLLPLSFTQIRAFIETENTPSIRLFEKAGFSRLGEEDGLFTYAF